MHMKNPGDYDNLIIKLHNTELKDLITSSKKISCTNEKLNKKNHLKINQMIHVILMCFFTKHLLMSNKDS